MKSNVSLEDLHQECQELSGQLKARTRKASRRRSHLRRFLEKARVDLARDLQDFPEFHGRHYEKYGEFRRSFELLDVQIQSLLKKLDEQAITLPAPVSYPASESIDEWLDHLDDLEEVLQDYERQLERQYRADLLDLIKALDTVERVVMLDIPSAMSGRKIYYSALEQLKQTTQNLGRRLRNSLRGRFVKTIDIRVGQYPPLEITRFISRQDDGTSDNIVVAQVIEKGYLWKGQVLRKVAVITATQREED